MPKPVLFVAVEKPEMKTLEALRSLVPFQLKNIEWLEAKIKARQPAADEEAIELIVSKMDWWDVLAITEYSSTIRQFCQRSCYEDKWQDLMSYLKSNPCISKLFVAKSNQGNIFDQFTGLLLAYEYVKWVDWHGPNHPETKALYDEIVKRDIVDLSQTSAQASFPCF